MTPTRASDDVPSPDGLHSARLLPAGEIRFGPQYFTLELDGATLRNRTFGGELVWSSDSHYLALQEWLTTSEAAGPHTQLLLVDVTRALECVMAQARGGFITPMRFEAGLLVYRKEYLGRGVVAELEQPIPAADRWQPMHEATAEQL